MVLRRFSFLPPPVNHFFANLIRHHQVAHRGVFILNFVLREVEKGEKGALGCTFLEFVPSDIGSIVLSLANRK